MKIQMTVMMTGLLLAVSAQASNYPPNYSYQKVSVIHDGAALFAQVGSGCGSSVVVGYKNSGFLAQFNPDHIDALIIHTCRNYEGDFIKRTRTLRLGREWHGTGYLADANSSSDWNGYSMGCDSSRGQLRRQIAFSDGQGHWDSRDGANYEVSNQDFYTNAPRVVQYETQANGCGDPTIQAWDIIINEMRK